MLSFEQQRHRTLLNIQQAGEILTKSTPDSLASYNIVFGRGSEAETFPFWHLLNGPIADALYHIGQVVAFRRTSGNPMHSGVNVFMGNTQP